MSSYVQPTGGGLHITYAGTNIGIWCNDTQLGPVLIAARLDPANGWLAFWTHGPFMETDWQAECDKMGGIVNLIKSLLAAINAAFQKLFNAAVPVVPSPTQPFSIDAMNQALAAGFVLSIGPTGPVIQSK